MTKGKVLWLSRHEMTESQVADLRGMMEGTAYGPMSEVVHLNVTFPSSGLEAAKAIMALAEEHECSVIAGVFPAHVGMRLASLREEWAMYHPTEGVRKASLQLRSRTIAIPVTVPTSAKEGETRGGGFVHDHWAWF